MEKYTVAHFEKTTEFIFENGDVIGVFHDTARCFIFNENDREGSLYIPMKEVLKRINLGQRIN